MLNRINFQQINNFMGQQNNTGFQGLSPAFFGPPSPQDRMMDLQICRQLGINPANMDRNTIKANILSKLTGKPVEQMRAFYSNAGEHDMKMDFHNLKLTGQHPSHNPNPMMARAENKSKIANAWINQNNNSKGGVNHNHHYSNNHQFNKGGNRPGDPMLNAMLDRYGLQNTGSMQKDIQSLIQFMVNQQLQNQYGINQANNMPPPPPPSNGENNGGPPPLPASILAIFNSLSITPTGDKQSDYGAVLNKLDTLEEQSGNQGEKLRLQNMRNTFISVFSTL